jgi:DNA repair protein SbcD/Mre11
VTSQHDHHHVGTLVHAADLHLGAPLNSLGAQVGDAQAQALRTQAAQAFDSLVDLTLTQQADVLVLAGDLYDQAEYEVRAQVRFATAMRRLVDAGVRVFIAHGNHDPLVASFRPAATLPAEVTVFAPDIPQVHTVTLRSGHTVDVAGVSFGRTHEAANLAQRFHTLSTDPRHTIGVLHTNVGSNTQHGDYAPCTVTDLDLAPVGYWALGHIHDRTVQPLGPGRWWAYSGNLQGRSTKATECGPKGALVVPILTEGFGEPQFHACDTVRFVRSDVDVTGADNVGDALDLVGAQLADLEQQADGRSLVARLRLTGATAAHHTLATQSDLLDLAREQNTTGALISTVEVATRPRIDRDQVLARDNLQSDIVRTLDDVADPDALLLDLVRNHVTGLAEARLQKQLDADPTLAKALLNRVETLLIDVLEDPS